MSALRRGRVGLFYWWRHGRWPAIASPRRFTEWVQWRKLNDRDPARARLTDKAHSKIIAAAALGDAYIIPTLWEGEALPRQAPWPMPFIVKANHGRGQFVVVRSVEDYRRARLHSAEMAESFLWRRSRRVALSRGAARNPRRTLHRPARSTADRL